MRPFIFSLAILMAFPAFPKPKAYFDVDDSLFASPRLVIDGKEYKPSFFGFRDIADAMQSNPEANELAQTSRLYGNWGLGLVLGGLVAALIYAQYSISNDSHEFNSGTYWAIFSAGFIPGVILQGRSQTKLIRAVNQYNGVYSIQETAKWELTPASKGVGLAIRF